MVVDEGSHTIHIGRDSEPGDSALGSDSLGRDSDTRRDSALGRDREPGRDSEAKPPSGDNPSSAPWEHVASQISVPAVKDIDPFVFTSLPSVDSPPKLETSESASKGTKTEETDTKPKETDKTDFPAQYPLYARS